MQKGCKHAGDAHESKSIIVCPRVTCTVTLIQTSCLFDHFDRCQGERMDGGRVVHEFSALLTCSSLLAPVLAFFYEGAVQLFGTPQTVAPAL